jgi:hypothetical protein
MAFFAELRSSDPPEHPAILIIDTRAAAQAKTFLISTFPPKLS